MKAKYPEKKLVFQHDNLLSHKSSLIMRIMQDKTIDMIYSPSHTPEFSAVENVFATMKR
jgi:transposase